MHADLAPAYEQLRRAFEQTREHAAGIIGTLRIGIYTPLSAGPHMVAVPIRDLPPSETGLAWLTAVHSPRVQAFASAASDILSHTELRP